MLLLYLLSFINIKYNAFYTAFADVFDTSIIVTYRTPQNNIWTPSAYLDHTIDVLRHL